jgi:predicted AAA+ superfamily ATPase
MTDMTSLRILKKSNTSFFLLGPRATGKSTWLKEQVHPDLIVDLLKAKDYQRFSTNLSLLREIIEGNPKFKTIVIDEVQKLPEILDEVHSLIFESKNRLQFILTGSSARKLKKKNVNLLAGRALVRYFHPFSCLEIESKFKIDLALNFGMLPQVWNLGSADEKKEYLTAYVDTYLKEEIQQEAAVRSLPSYLKFLEHFALRNSQVINIQNLAGEIGIPRTTINGYMDILEQTLMGVKLSPLHLKAKVKEVTTPKFYFFDPGVVRALSNQLDDDMGVEKGAQFETLVLHELKTYSDYFSHRWEFHYWGTPSENEVDFIIAKGKTLVGVEVKASKKWDKGYNAGLKVLLNAGKIKHAYGVYLGDEQLKSNGIMVLPFRKFVEYMHAGKLLTGS